MEIKNKKNGGAFDKKSFMPGYKKVEVTNDEGEKIEKKSVSLSLQVKYALKAIQELKGEIDSMKGVVK